MSVENIFPNAAQMDKQIDILAHMAAKMGAFTPPQTWDELANALGAGLIEQYVEVGDQLTVNKATSVTATASDGLTATVDLQAFVTAMDEARNKVYAFAYDGAAWRYNGESVALSAYGITLTGTPTEGATITVTETVQELTLDVLATDGYDIPANPAKKHAMTLFFHDLLTYNTLPYKNPQALYYVDAEVFPSGLAAGTTYTVTLDHGAYNGSTTQDGTYGLTPTKAIPVGGMIKHSSIGTHYSNAADYTVDKILAGTWTTYDADGEVLESGLVTLDNPSGATSLGTATVSNPTYRVTPQMNYTQRNAYGSNDPRYSLHHLWYHSDAPGAASGAVASWWKKQTPWDIPYKSTLPGLLYGIDPSFLKHIGKVRKRTALATCDGGGYVDSDELVWDISMTELGRGKNNKVNETPVDTDGNARADCYPFYEGATQEDFIKYSGGVVRYWFFRSPSPSYASNVRLSGPDGSLHVGDASNTLSACAGLCVVA